MMVDIQNPCPELWTLPGSLQGAIHPAQIGVTAWMDHVAGQLMFLVFLRNLGLTCKGFDRTFQSVSKESCASVAGVFDV